MESPLSIFRMDHEPTPNPSQEGNWQDADERLLPSWEGSGVGRFLGRAMNYFDILTLAMPETIVSIAALAVLFVDLGVMRSAEGKWRRLVAAAITSMGCLLPIFWMFQVEQHTTAEAWHGMLVIDPLTQLVKQAVLVLTVFAAWLSVDSTFTEQVGEYFALLMLAAVGMMFMVGSENVLLIFISLELISLALY